MIRLRIGTLLFAYPMLYLLGFILGSGTFSAAGPDIDTRGKALTYIVFGFVLPIVLLGLGGLLAMFGMLAIHRDGRRAAAAGEAPRPVGWLQRFPVAYVVVSLLGVPFVGIFAHGCGEAFSRSEAAQYAVRIVQRFEACGETTLSADDVEMLVFRGDWPIVKARECADCLDEHPECIGEPACEDACSIGPPVPSIAEFGGGLPRQFVGTWELQGSTDGRHRFVYNGDGTFEQISEAESRVIRGAWRARGTTIENTVEVLHQPDASSPGRPWIESIHLISSTRFRWEQDGLEFTRVGEASVGAADAAAASVATSEAIETDRADQCQRACRPYRTCIREGGDSYECSPEITRACRECRSEGLGR